MEEKPHNRFKLAQVEVEEFQQDEVKKPTE
jgi:hypothetical protein